jgi:hypothetical protein
MIKFTTALLMLGIVTAMTTTAIAHDWWAGCNPQARGCRQLSSPHVKHHHNTGHHSG